MMIHLISHLMDVEDDRPLPGGGELDQALLVWDDPSRGESGQTALPPLLVAVNIKLCLEPVVRLAVRKISDGDLVWTGHLQDIHEGLSHAA